MAELEEHDGGSAGSVRQWLARASRARRDRAWVADGIVQNVWAPFSPVSGAVGAFAWREPPEQVDGALLGFEAAEPVRDADSVSEPVPVLPLVVHAAEPPEASAVAYTHDGPKADDAARIVEVAKPADLPKPVDLPKPADVPKPAEPPRPVTPPLPDDPGPQAPEDEPASRPFKLFS
jgi:HemY protein